MPKQKKYNSLKLWLGRRALNKKIKHQNRVVNLCPLKKAGSVGLTYVIKTPTDIDTVKNAARQLVALGIKTHVLCYLPVKKPDGFYLSQKGFNFFSDNDLDFKLRPTNEAVIEFVNTKFDILIDLGSDNYFPMEYILNVSEASFKVGWFNPNGAFDFMMQIDKQKGSQYYFDQVIHYLTQLT